MEARDALLFDRVYQPVRRAADADVPAKIAFGFADVDDACASYLSTAAFGMAYGGYLTPDDARDYTFGIIQERCAEHGIQATTSLRSERTLRMLYPAGDHRARLAALGPIPLVEPGQVEWENVREFRADHDAVARYRQLAAWAHATMPDDSIAALTDRLGSTILAYDGTIRKHGLATREGTLLQLLSFGEWLPAGFEDLAAGIAAGGTRARVIPYFVRQQSFRGTRHSIAQAHECR